MGIMSTAKTIKIAADFSDEPFGRHPEDGDENGQRFREEILFPSLQKFDIVIIDFDGAEGYGSSFLEESFGGLVRKHGYKPEALLQRLRFKSDEDDSLITEVIEYIKTSIPQS